jgi:4-hydroxyphenylpyruvate dioxygenase
MRTSIATVSVGGTLTGKLAAIAQAGFDGVEIFENDLVASPLPPDGVRALAADLGLAIELYQPLRDIEAVAPDRFAANLKRAERKLALMQRLGAPMLLVCSNVSPDAIDDDALAAQQLADLAERAAQRGIRVAYEALAWGRHVSTYEHSWRIVRAADHPALGVCLDSFHILSRGGDPAGIRRIPGEKIFFLQLADAPLLGMDVLQWSRHHRCFPGQGDFDLPGFLEQVAAAGYAGPLSLEVFSDTFRQAEPESTAVDAMRSLLYLHDALRQRRGDRDEPPGPGTFTWDHGLAFAELAAPATATPALADSLRALGFTRVGAHHTKNAALWRHGTAHLVVNTETGERAEREPELTALGVRTADSAMLAKRAEHYLAPVLPRRRGAGEADLPSVRTPAGITLLFCQDDGWIADFTALTGSDQPSGRGGTLTGIDHVALASPFDRFDDTVLFLRAVLGLQPGENLDLADPYGLVRSRALTSAHGPGGTGTDALRIALNVPPLGSHTGPGAQHVAFTSTDAFATQAAMRAAGAPLLAIPDNYYEDLQARFDLDEPVLARLRGAAMLYDRDARGAFLHFYTALLGPHLFLEVVQRVGAYDGYGAANASIRLAAQHGRPSGSEA